MNNFESALPTREELFLRLPKDQRRWVDGGCVSFALALEEVAWEFETEVSFGGHRNSHGQLEHVFVHTKDAAYDAFGKHSLPYKIEGLQEQYNLPIDDILKEIGYDDEEVLEATEDAFTLWQAEDS